MFLKLPDFVGPFVRQYIIVILVNLSLISSGLGIAWSSPVLVKLSDETSPVLGKPLTEQEGSWVVSVTFVSAFFLSFISTYSLDRIGRKKCIILSSLPRICCYIFMVNATEVWMIIVGRLLVGFADAILFTSVPMYASEIGNKEIRGSLGAFFNIFVSMGVLIMLCIGPYIDFFTLNKMVLAIVTVTTFPLIFLPDSPYFLYRKGRTDEATEILVFLRGSLSLAKEELSEYKEADTDVKNETALTTIFKSKGSLKALAIVIVLGAGTQLSGYNAVTFYLQTVLESTKTSISSQTASVVIGVIHLFAGVCTALVAEKFGRKPILAGSLFGQILAMLGLGSFFYVHDAGYPIQGFLNYLPLVSMVLLVFCYSYGLGSLVFPLMSELFDGKTRTIGVFFGFQSSAVFIFLTTRFFVPISNLIGPATMYWIFSVNSILLCLFIIYCIPETMGKSFGEIQTALDSSYNGDSSKNDEDNKC